MIEKRVSNGPLRLLGVESNVTLTYTWIALKSTILALVITCSYLRLALPCIHGEASDVMAVTLCSFKYMYTHVVFDCIIFCSV